MIWGNLTPELELLCQQNKDPCQTFKDGLGMQIKQQNVILYEPQSRVQDALGITKEMITTFSLIFSFTPTNYGKMVMGIFLGGSDRRT